MSKTLKKSFSLLLAILTIFSCFSLTLISASAKSNYTVTTKSNWSYPGHESITVKQVAEKYYKNLKHTKTSTHNIDYQVVCRPIRSSDGKSHKTITKTFHSNSIKIDLDSNVTYSVSITKTNNPYNYYGSFGTISAGYAYISGACKATYY